MYEPTPSSLWKMMSRMKTGAKLSTHILFAAISCFRINSLFSVSPPKHPLPHPFIIISSSTFQTSNHPPLRLQDLAYAFDCITNIHEAQALFHYMLQIKPLPPIWDYHKLLHVVLQMEHYSHVVLMFKKWSLKGCPVDEYVMSTVIYSYCHLKQVDLGFAIVADFIKRGYAPNIVCFNCLIRGLFLEGNVAKAVDLFKKIIVEGLAEVDEYTIPIVLDGLSKSGNLGNAIELLRISEEHDWKVNVVGYSAVIDGLCKCGMLKEGMDILFRMIGRDVLPNVVTYNILIHGLCKHGKLDFARSMFKDLPSKGIYPNVITYTVIIQGLCREGIFREAKEMLTEMERLGCSPSFLTYNVIIQSCLQLHHRGNIHSINLLREIVGRDFQLCATTFFQLIGQLKVIRQMPGIYDDYIINHLIRKLTSSRAIHQTPDSNDKVMISSLRQKLIS